MYSQDLELESFCQAQAEEAQMRWEYEMDAYYNELYEKEQAEANRYSEDEKKSWDKFNNAFKGALRGAIIA